MVSWLRRSEISQIWPLPTRTRLGQPCIRPCYCITVCDNILTTCYSSFLPMQSYEHFLYKHRFPLFCWLTCIYFQFDVQNNNCHITQIKKQMLRLSFKYPWRYTVIREVRFKVPPTVKNYKLELAFHGFCTYLNWTLVTGV